MNIETEDDVRRAEARPLKFSPKYFLQRYAFMVPVATGIAMISTNRWFTEVDDECAIIEKAARPVRETIQLFLQGIGQHEHPPLYDIIFHAWLRITHGNEYLLRLPSIVFYLVGAWTIARVAKHLGGESSRNWVLLLLAVWPFGFHFGRLATWYSFCFLLVSFLTLVYFRFVKRPTSVNWVWLVAAALALVYANYFGWAFLACLAIDYILRNRGSAGRTVWPLAITTAVLLFAYIPLFRVFAKEVRYGVEAHGLGFATIVSGMFNTYCLFVSESVAPWFWYWSIPAGIAIVSGLGIVVARCAPPERRFLLYFVALFLLMTVAGIVQPKRVLLISPWLVMPIGVTLGTLRVNWTRRALAASLAIPAAIGWYGIFVRNLYAAPHWVEPWESIARKSATVVEGHGIVIGNNPSFFFYLTYLLHADPSATAAGFTGLLPGSVRVAGVYDPQQWADAGRPSAQTVELVKGVHYSISEFPTQEAEDWLGRHCKLQEVEQEVPDSGVRWKRRYAPQIDQPDWRVEVRTYACE